VRVADGTLEALGDRGDCVDLGAKQNTLDASHREQALIVADARCPQSLPNRASYVRFETYMTSALPERENVLIVTPVSLSCATLMRCRSTYSFRTLSNLCRYIESFRTSHPAKRSGSLVSMKNGAQP